MSDNFGLNDIDKMINDSLSQPTLIDSMEEDSKRQSERKMAWAGEIKQYWYIYLLLVISAVFTATLGLFMGLSPTLVTHADGSQAILFNTDTTHVLLAILYMIAFVGVTELQFAIAKHKFSEREEGNPTQAISMLVAMTIAVVGIIGTGIAGGMVVASNIAFLSDYREIPHSAQKWVIIVIPCMLAIYSILYTAYALSSEYAKAERLTRDRERKMRLDHKTRMINARMVGERALQAEEIKAYWRLVEMGKLDAGEARAAIEAGMTLGQLEKKTGRDLDGNGNVGTVRARAISGPASPMPSHVMPENVIPVLACSNCGGSNLAGAKFCGSCGAALADKVTTGRNGSKPGF